MEDEEKKEEEEEKVGSTMLYRTWKLKLDWRGGMDEKKRGLIGWRRGLEWIRYFGGRVVVVVGSASAGVVDFDGFLLISPQQKAGGVVGCVG